MDKLELLTQWIKESDNIVFFGGAGVSTESGVPDFRSKDGLYNQHDVRFEGYSAEYLLSHSCLVDEPKVFYEFYRQKMNTTDVQPNAAHRFLANLEETGKLKAVVTQNIDGLHQKAGSKTVYELHGTTLRNFCAKCAKVYSSDAIFSNSDPIPRCNCGGQIRPYVTLYEESLPYDAVEGAVESISKADMLIVGGTSLTVYPAASYIGYFKGKYLVVINREYINLNYGEHFLQINESIGQVFSQIEPDIFGR